MPELFEQLGLTRWEYDRIRELQGREPTHVELAVFSLMWSEHCGYKHSKPLLKRFPTTGRHVLQGPGENAGIVDIGGGVAVAMKIESHNHPSAVEPYQGAATGVGGIIRDIFAMGARPICGLDSLRFGEIEPLPARDGWASAGAVAAAAATPDIAPSDAVLNRQRYLFEQVVAGVGGYGNCMGIPTVAGEIYFEDPYAGNCLVNAMTVGLVRQDEIIRSSAAGVGNHVVLIGSKTGRDGIGGASVLASQVFDETLEEKRPSVQVGDPFTEKKLLEACLELLRGDLLVALQDLGAAGITSSSSEMAAKGEVGIDLHADRVPLREADMEPWEIMISESQERMLAIVAPDKWAGVEAVCDRWDLDATIVGGVTDTKQLRVFFKGEMVGDMDANALAEPPCYLIPQERPAHEVDEPLDPTDYPLPDASLDDILLDLIGSPNIASRRWVYQQYDHQNQLNTVIVPGGDAALLRIKRTGAGIAVCTDGNGRQTYLDPYRGGKAAVAEAARNVSCVGAKPIAITNCLNFGNPGNGPIAYQLAQAIEGMAEACEALGTPVISGNVSLYNESFEQPIYPTAVVGMLGVMDDVTANCTVGFKDVGDQVYLLGDAAPALDGSEYQKRWFGGPKGRPAGRIPDVDLAAEVALQKLVQQAIAARLLKSAHDCADGGLAVALAESCLAGGVGADLKLGRVHWQSEGRAAHLAARPDIAFFGETPTLAVVSVTLADEARLKGFCESANVPCQHLGTVGGTDLGVNIGALGEASPGLKRLGRPPPGRLRIGPAEGHGGMMLFPDESPHDECGVFAIYAPEMDVARLTFFALFALQHRGQESAGIAVTDGARLTVHKDMGLVSQVFEEAILKTLPGQLAIGHVRYSTTGSSEQRNAQPFARTRNGSFIALAHNGNLVNTDELRSRLLEAGHVFESTSDTEVIAALLAEHPSRDVRGALRDIIPRLRGAFSAVLLTSDAVYGFRDPYGIRPLVLGQVENRYCLASESSGLDIIGAKLLREIEPGEICWIDKDGYHIEQVVDRKREALCVFEFIYFARPDSIMKGQTLYAARSRMGEILAGESPVEADLVIPVPDTGNSAAIGYAAGSGITYGEALIKNRYIGRTFISPEDRVRKLGIRMKFNPLSSAIQGKRLVVVDDSIVRGNTTRALVRVLFEAGAKEVHLRISSPPIIFPCFYGIDMADQDEFIAFGKSVEEISEELGATSVAYLSLAGLMRATGVGDAEGCFCTACFTGDYPCEVPEQLRLSKFRYEESGCGSLER